MWSPPVDLKESPCRSWSGVRAWSVNEQRRSGPSASRGIAGRWVLLTTGEPLVGHCQVVRRSPEVLIGIVSSKSFCAGSSAANRPKARNRPSASSTIGAWMPALKGSVPVEAPLRHVAVHVVQAPGVRRLPCHAE